MQQKLLLPEAARRADVDILRASSALNSQHNREFLRDWTATGEIFKRLETEPQTLPRLDARDPHLSVELVNKEQRSLLIIVGGEPGDGAEHGPAANYYERPPGVLVPAGQGHPSTILPSVVSHHGHIKMTWTPAALGNAAKPARPQLVQDGTGLQDLVGTIAAQGLEILKNNATAERKQELSKKKIVQV